MRRASVVERWTLDVGRWTFLLLSLCALTSCATRARTYQPPDPARVHASTERLGAAVHRAAATAAKARATVATAKTHAAKVSDLSVAMRTKIDALIADLPADLRPRGLSLRADAEVQTQAEVSLGEALQQAEVMQADLEQQLAEAQREKDRLVQEQAAYHAEAQKLADAASQENEKRIKAEKALSWYRWHWWGSWIALGVGVLACLLFAFLKFTGRLALKSGFP